MTCKESQWEQFIVLQLICSQAKKLLCLCIWVMCTQEPGSLESQTVGPECLCEIEDCKNI